MDRETCFSLAQASSEERTKAARDVQFWLDEQITTLEHIVKNCRVGLYIQGLTASDVYHAMAKKEAFKNERTRVLPRVRWDERYGTPSFGWETITCKYFPVSPDVPTSKTGTHGRNYVAYVRRNKQATPQKMRVVILAQSIHIQKATDGIAPSAFDKEPDWAQFAGEATEKKLRPLRKQLKLIANISRQLAVLKKLRQQGGIQ